MCIGGRAWKGVLLPGSTYEYLVFCLVIFQWNSSIKPFTLHMNCFSLNGDLPSWVQRSRASYTFQVLVTMNHKISHAKALYSKYSILFCSIVYFLHKYRYSKFVLHIQIEFCPCFWKITVAVTDGFSWKSIL